MPHIQQGWHPTSSLLSWRQVTWGSVELPWKELDRNGREARVSIPIVNDLAEAHGACGSRRPQVGSGSGSFFRIPMAVVTIGGVLVAGFFTLFLIPVIYQKLDRFAFAAHTRQKEVYARETAPKQRRYTDEPAPEGDVPV